jgi:hypothetical protein
VGVATARVTQAGPQIAAVKAMVDDGGFGRSGQPDRGMSATATAATVEHLEPAHAFHAAR